MSRDVLLSTVRLGESGALGLSKALTCPALGSKLNKSNATWNVLRLLYLETLSLQSTSPSRETKQSGVPERIWEALRWGHTHTSREVPNVK